MGKGDGWLKYRPQRTNYSLSDRNCPLVRATCKAKLLTDEQHKARPKCDE